MIRPICLALLAAASSASAVVIQLDYTYDIADGGNFFGTHATAKTTLEQAAADLSAALTGTLGTITSDVFTANQGGANASIDWDLSPSNPVTDAFESIPTFSFPANTITIFVGMRPLSGSTLGQGGPTGVDVGFGVGGTTGARVGAFDAAEANSNTVMARGAGPIMGTISGSFNTGGGTAAYALTYGTLAGTLSFDNDSDNNGTPDSFATLDNYWHFELTSPSLDGQNDFYSVALHEMLHAIGFGTADTWDAKRSGTTWLGSEAIALAGSGSNLVTTNGHIREGVSSFRLSDGAAQETVMDPALLVGTRKSLTQLDLAFLRDLGYATIPEPSTAALFATALLLISRRKSRSPAPFGGKSCRRS